MTATVNNDEGSVFFFGLLCDKLAELCQDLVLTFCAFLVVELGKRSLLIGTVDLVLFTQTNSFHTTMSAHHIWAFLTDISPLQV